jgi:hypothetical protein
MRFGYEIFLSTLVVITFGVLALYHDRELDYIDKFQIDLVYSTKNLAKPITLCGCNTLLNVQNFRDFLVTGLRKTLEVKGDMRAPVVTFIGDDILVRYRVRSEIEQGEFGKIVESITVDIVQLKEDYKLLIFKEYQKCLNSNLTEIYNEYNTESMKDPVKVFKLNNKLISRILENDNCTLNFNSIMQTTFLLDPLLEAQLIRSKISQAKNNPSWVVIVLSILILLSPILNLFIRRIHTIFSK